MRERNLHKFSSGKATVVVATDVAARGIHVDDVGLVVHFDAADRRQGLPAPLRPHRPRRRVRLRRHDHHAEVVDEVVRLQRGAGVDVLHHDLRTAPRPMTAEALAETGSPTPPRSSGGARPQGGRSFSGGPRKTYGGQAGGARRPEGRPDSRGEGPRRGGRPGGASRWSDNGR